jgi:hypothetical protein
MRSKLAATSWTSMAARLVLPMAPSGQAARLEQRANKPL